MICKWLSKDPIGIAGGLNQYVAFGNNPVMFVDPLGVVNWWTVAKNGIGFVANTVGAVASGVLATTGFGTVPGAIAGTYCAYAAGANLGNIFNEFYGNKQGPSGPASMVAQVGMLSGGMDPSSTLYLQIDYGAQALDLFVPLVATAYMPNFNNLPPVPAEPPGTVLGSVVKFIKSPEDVSMILKGSVYTDSVLTAIDSWSTVQESVKCLDN